MSKRILVVLSLALGLACATPMLAKSKSANKAQLSKAKKKKRALARKKREKHIVREKVKKGSTNVNFEDVSIDGQVKMPMDGIIKSTKGDKGYQFVKVRTRWHPEMIRSVSELGYAGNGRR